jgi:hypothetical protein
MKMRWQNSKMRLASHGQSGLADLAVRLLWESSWVVFEWTLAMAWLSGTAAAQQAHRLPPDCQGIETILRVSSPAVKAGSEPVFTLVLRNRSGKAVRLLDVRAGRRGDLAETYYELVLESNGRRVENLTRPISDPGPIDAADYFVLSPATVAVIPIGASTDLTTLRIGQYAAHVRITLDPLSTPVPSCQSARTSFKVYAGSTAKELDARNKKDTSTPEGQEYENKAVGVVWRDAHFMGQCAPPTAPIQEPFTIYIEVKRDGTVGTLLMDPDTNVSKCIRKHVASRRFDKPAREFVVKIRLSFEK